MCTIVLNDILTKSENLPAAGMKFYDLVEDAFAQSEKVIVDMEQVSSLPSIFLNVSFGRIIENYGVEKLQKNISFIKITKAQAERFKEYVTKYKA